MAGMDLIRAQGATAVAEAKERRALAQQLSELEWGQGSGVQSFSPATWQMVAAYLQRTGCSPAQIDILGGKLYLNEQYWRERMSSDPSFRGFRQERVSHDALRMLTGRATRYADNPNVIKPEMAEAAWRKVEQMEDWISRYNVEDDARVFCYVTLITREIGGQRVVLEEANTVDLRTMEKYKGVHPAKKFPEKTARSRSLRRCAAKAFAAFVGTEREETVLNRQLEGTLAEQVPTLTGEVEQAPDVGKLRRTYFASLKAVPGLSDNDTRRRWQAKYAKEYGWPESASEWSASDFAEATELIASHVRGQALELLGDMDLEEVSLEVLDKAAPEWATDWAKIRDSLNTPEAALADGRVYDEPELEYEESL